MLLELLDDGRLVVIELETGAIEEVLGCPVNAVEVLRILLVEVS